MNKSHGDFKGIFVRRIRTSLGRLMNNRIPELTNPVTDEFLNRSFFNPPAEIQLQITLAQKQLIYDRTQEAWNQMGEEEPHWSVITDEKYLSKNISRNRKEFFESGKESIEMLKCVLLSIGVSKEDFQNQSVIELGCGLGRLTLHLANNFKNVLGLDISPSHLQQCTHSMSEFKVENVELSLVQNLDDLDFKKDFDIFYSIITLQHNPPPAQLALLAGGLQSLKLGGIFYFQLPTFIPGYSFIVDEYLKSPRGKMEMHAIPQKLVIDFLRTQGCEVMSIIKDNMTGNLYDSYTFVGVKVST